MEPWVPGRQLRPEVALQHSLPSLLIEGQELTHSMDHDLKALTSR